MQLKPGSMKLDEFKLVCKKNRLKITPQRIAVYRELMRSHGHPTADDVYQAMKEDFSNISYDTVNRTLHSLAVIGVIDAVESPGGPRRFDPNTRCHHHLYCIKCGKIIDFFSRACDDLPIPETIGDDFTVLSKRVVIKGICKNCGRNNRPEKLQHTKEKEIKNGKNRRKHQGSLCR